MVYTTLSRRKVVLMHKGNTTTNAQMGLWHQGGAFLVDSLSSSL